MLMHKYSISSDTIFRSNHMYRLLAIDLDGTLLTPSPHKLITPRTYKALHKAVENGMAIVIATGQMLQVLRAVCAGLPLTAPQIIENGALVVDILSGVVLHEKLMPVEHILPTLETLRTFGFFRAYHTYERVYVDYNTPVSYTHLMLPTIYSV
ncbi:MAG TPA: hypothetical protein DCK85_06525 [Ktedonobacter sp.]|nr:hypothetical protein [Ktedonobacter sp.]